MSRAAFIEPCLPSPADKPPSGSNWIHEIKHDGYRLMARRDPVGIRLLTRNGNDWSARFPLVVEAVNHLNVRSCLIDGEVVCCDERGLAIFSTLRRRRNEARAFLFAFDLLDLDGLDMRREPIETRKATLASLLRKGKPGGASERAHSASQRRRRVSSRLQTGCRGNCVEAPRLALSVWPLAGLAEVQESGSTGGEARGRGRLGTMSSSGGRFSFRDCSVSKASLVQVRAMSARTTLIRGFGAFATIL
jgi:ATP dependent DNA ligase domain